MKYIISILIILGMLTACQGKKGDTGLTGQTGAAGPQGPSGLDGTQITVIQFCPNSNSSYPSTFPEVGLCINDNLYAVYSANNGFLALIPPGNYNSNAVGSSCNFTVSTHCQVQ